MKEIPDLRNDIDKIDDKIIESIFERFKKTEQIGIFKKRNNMESVDMMREAEQFERFRKKAEKLGLDADLVEKIFKLVIAKAVENHNNMM